MGRTLFGIDLDASPLGGVVERLLDEEDLAKLEAVPDGGERPDDGEGDAADDNGGGGDAADDNGGEGDAADDNGGEGDAADDSDGDAVRRSGGDESDRGGRTDEGRIPNVRGATRRIPVVGDDAGEGDESASDGGGDGPGRFAGLRSRLRPVALALAALAVLAVVVALVVWRYGDRIKALIPGRLRRGGGDGSEPVEVTTGERDGPASESGDDEATPDDESAGTATDAAGDAPDGGESTDQSGTDLGALVALAFLALVAALVRKRVEGRPHDPLVDE